MKKLCLVSVLLTLLFTACKEKPQSAKTFDMQGSVEGLADGSQLLLANDEGAIIDTLTIEQGKFKYTAPADTVCFMTLFVKDNPENNVNFFTEPGTITITLTDKNGESTVAGTTANDALQLLMNDTKEYYDKIAEIENTVYSDTTLNADSEWALGERYMQILSEISKKLAEHAEKNIDNELGYLLVLRYIDEEENTELVNTLIAKMPENMRERQPVKNLQAHIQSIQKTAAGTTISDFTLSTPDGQPLSIMSEVKKNKLTIIDFWASWCGPCRSEMPMMRQLYADYHEKGLGIVGVSLDEDAAAWRKAIDELQLTWPQMSDLKGWNAAPAQTFNITAIPHTIIVDNSGTILKRGLRGNALQQFVSQQLP